MMQDQAPCGGGVQSAHNAVCQLPLVVSHEQQHQACPGHPSPWTCTLGHMWTPATCASVAIQVLGLLAFGVVTAISMWLATTTSAISQSGECVLVADDRDPDAKIMRCGDDLVVRTAHGTRYHPIDQQGQKKPKSLQLDTGALMIEFHPSDAQKTFQILTPHAIAAVRGTKWVVEVRAARTSTLVISGEVAVSRLHAKQTVVVKPGEGVDISSKAGSIAAKRWPKKRVRALLARFGE
jgi:hypothetical protein